MHRHHINARGISRPPSAAPSNAGIKRKEREYEQETGDETNINVVVRCRGRSEREVRENSGVVVSTTGVKGNTVELSMGPNAVSNKTYHFDKVFSPAADQAIIFDDVVSPILSEMLGGYNCTIFAYGQTGTGKTYTMSGDMTESCGLLTDAAGIIPRVLQSLFQKLEAEETECSVKCSFIELYNEELRDLLAADESVKLKIYDDANKKSHSTTVQGMEESHISSAAGGIKLLQRGSHRRQVAATKCNDLSSRSHTVFTITTYVKKSSESTEDYICSGKLNLVDLAGSENIQRSGAENKRAVEAGLINKSLLTLGRVINALVDKSSHIPYRESKLTRLLQDSLGGRTKTCIIATVSPARSNLEETISTLDYAFRAKNIRNKPQVNSMISKKTLLREFTTEIEKLKSELIATRQRNGVYLTNEKFEEMTVESESRRILSEEQKARIETMEVSLRNKVQELFTLTNNFTNLKKDNEATRVLLESTKDVLQKTEIVLADTRENLEQESQLRQKYAVTESRLHHMGNELISTIGASLKDVESLHAKLRRRSALHGQNQQRWENIRTHGNDTLSTVHANLQVLEEEHSAALEGVSERIRRFVSDELEHTSQAQSLLTAGITTLSESAATTTTQTSKARDNMNEVLEEIKVLRDDVKAKVGEGLNGLSDAAARISGEVILELGQFHTQLHTSYSSLGKEFKAIFDDLTKQLVLQREEADRLRTELQEANHKNIAASLSTASQLEAAVEAERKAAEVEREQLLQQMTELVNMSTSNRERRLNDMLSAAQTNIIDASEKFEAADKAYGDGMDQWNVKDSAYLEKVISSRDSMKTKMKSDWSAVNARNTAIQESTQAVHKETVKIVEAQVAAMATQMAALDEFVARARRQNDNHHTEHISSLEEMCSRVRKSFECVQTRLASSPTEIFNTSIKAQLEVVASTLVDIQDKAREPLYQLQEELADQEMADYIPTGQTPQKRDWQYPTDLPRTIPLPDSTTPKTNPPTTSSFSRTPGKSPRKHASPRKTPKKHIVRADTPPTSIPIETQPALKTDAPVKPSASLKDLDVNVLSLTAPTTTSRPTSSHTATEPSTKASFSSTTSTSSDHSATTTISTTTSRLPTKSGAPATSRTNSFTSGSTATAANIEKENIPALNANLVAAAVAKEAIVTAMPPPAEKGRGKDKEFSKSMYAPRLTRSSTAAMKRDTVADFGRSLSG
ncbi:Kinesin- motor protein [Neophaeococcomyces mojaviensis]|uniref:Kinesin- motor protein n=1 Tax=Neophaeococcomyces mojaviensis TaxID=3383035 RepID=A0ACC3AKH3_9EURO|nr:Kinesin- motor protein [Knufia sp. JES_112]